MKKQIYRIKKSFKKRGVIKTFFLALKNFIFSLPRLPQKIKTNAIYSFKKIKATDSLIIKRVKGNNRKMLLNLKDGGISKELLITGYHEKNSTNFIKQEIRPGMNIVEIGANIGYYTLIEANIIGQEGHIHAFEPDPVNMKHLKMNIILNDLGKNVSFYPVAVGNENKKTDFYLASFGNLGSMVKREDDLCSYKKIEVDMVKLDDKLFGKKIDYFRMDVEGFEVEIIKSMDKILSSSEAPYGMFIEIHSELLHKINSSAMDFMNSLKKYGYKIKKAFYRGKSGIVVNSNEEFINHPMREKGYWETFFYKK